MNAKVKNTTIITLLALALTLALVAAVLLPPATGAAESINPRTSTSAVVTNEDILPDGQVKERLTQAPEGYTAIGGDSGKDFSAVRSNPSGKYILMGDIAVNTLDTTTNFSGVLDGNGYKIALQGTYDNTGSFNAGGLFADVTGTIKNLTLDVRRFEVGVGSSGNHYAGMICGQLYGNGLIENVKLELNYSPSNNGTGTECDHYMYAYGNLSGKYDLILGGVAGLTNENATLRNVTVENNAEGQGFSARSMVTSPWLGTNTTGAAVGGFVGRAGSSSGTTTTFQNVTYTGSSSSYIAVRAHSTGSGKAANGNAGVLAGWVYSNLNVTGLDLDWGIGVADYSNYGTSGAGKIIRQNINGNNSCGTLTGLTDSSGSITMSNVFIRSDEYVSNPASITYLFGSSQNAGGAIIYSSCITVDFDKNTAGNIIFGGASSDVMGSEDLLFGVRIGEQVLPLYKSLIVNGEEEKKENLSVSVAMPARQFDGANVSAYWQKAYYGTASYAEQSKVDEAEGQTTAQYTFNNEQAKVYVNSDRTKDIGYAYASSSSAVNAGKYELTLNEDYIYESGGARYLVDIAGGGFADISSLAQTIIVTVNPAAVTGSITGDLSVTYGEELASVLSGLKLELGNTYADFAGVSSLAVTTALKDGNGEEYSTHSSAGSVFDISVTSLSPNYDLSGVECTATVTVAKRAVTGYVVAPQNAVYDGAEHGASFYAYSGSAANNENIAELLTYSYAATGSDSPVEGAPVNAGNYTVTASFPEGSNYTFAEDGDNVTTTASFEISKADVTWNASKNQFGYMGEKFDPVWSIVGVNEDDSAALTQAVSEKWESGSAPQAEGTYKYVLTFAGNENYNESEITVSFSVRKVQVTLSVTADGEINVPYGSNIEIVDLGGGEFTVNGVKVHVKADILFGSGVEMADMQITLTHNASNGANAGEYMLTASAQAVESYDVISSSPLAFNIVPKSASVPVKDGAITSKVYDGKAAENLEELFTDESGLGLVITIKDGQGGIAESIVNAGQYTITATFASPNYSGSGSVVYTVEKANPAPAVSSIVRTGSGAIVTMSGGNAGVEYSLDGTTWAALPQNGVITLPLTEKANVSFRYAATQNIAGEATAVSEVALTYNALEESISSLPQNLTYGNLGSWSSMSDLANLALAGEKSETFDSLVSGYKAQEEQLKAQAQSAVQGAFGTAGALTSGSGVPAEQPEKGGNNTTLVLAIVLPIVGAAVIAAVAAIVIVTIKKKKRAKENEDDEQA